MADDLISIVGCSRRQAVALLEAFAGNANLAAEAFFNGETDDILAAAVTSSGSRKSKSKPNVGTIDSWFDRYRDPEDEQGESMSDEGIAAFCADIGLDPQDVVVLAIAHAMQAADMSGFSREEFQKGMLQLGVDSPAQLQAALPRLRKKLENATTAEYREVYTFAFDFAKQEASSKNLPLDEAVALWQVLLTPAQAPLLAPLCAYFTATGLKQVGKDLWAQTLVFLTQTLPDFSNYSEQDAWPVALDDFVAHSREQQSSSGSSSSSGGGGGSSNGKTAVAAAAARKK